MLSGELQGRLLALLSSLSNAKNILELGAFTGYSAICLAQGLDGAIAINNNADNPNSSGGGSNDPLRSHDDMSNSIGATTAIKKRRVITCEPDVKSAMIAQKYITKGGFSDQVGR
jgi:predicted O-methyltransferase YrrM